MNPLDKQSVDELCINSLRMLSIDAVQQANSGHPGLPLGAATMAYVLWTRYLRHNPTNPIWPDRDRYVHSAGHGSALLYALLYVTGHDLSLEDIKNFRQWQSKTPGHPERDLRTGIESTTGPLGQGFGMGVGMALAERYLAADFNRPGFPIVDHHTYGIVSDGDLMEGISSEAASLAGHLRLGKLVYLYDDNHISIEGDTTLAFTEDVAARFLAYGWHVQRVEDGNDIAGIDAAIRNAREETGRPSLVMVRTHIGYGSPKQDKASAHGEPLGEEALKATKEFFGWPQEPRFYVPEKALAHFRQAVDQGRKLETQWKEMFARYRAEFPAEAEKFEQQTKGELPAQLGRGYSCVQPERRINGNSRCFRKIAERNCETCIRSDRRFRRSRALDKYIDLRLRGPVLRDTGWPQCQIRCPGTWYGCGSERHGFARRCGALWSYISHIFGLYEAVLALIGFDGCSLDFYFHARQHRAWRRRPDASTGGTFGFSEGDTELHGNQTG